MKRLCFVVVLLHTALTLCAQVPPMVEAVDLALPSGTKWANINIGATTQFEYGAKYAWRELETKIKYDMSNYLYYYDSGNPNLEWMGSSSNISGTDYDVAHVRWGENWRMPTAKEYEELMNNCKREKTSVEGVSGIRYTGANGHSIFLPNGMYWTASKPIAGYNSMNNSYCWDSSKDYRRWTGRYVLEDYVQYYDASNVAEVVLGLYVRPVMNDEPDLNPANIIELNENENNTFTEANGIIKITKTFHHGWNTFAVPFNLDNGSRQLPTLFCNNAYRLYTFDRYLDGTLYFKNAGTDVKANTPYLLWYDGPTQKVTKYITSYWYKDRFWKVGVNTSPSPCAGDGNYTFMGTYDAIRSGSGELSNSDYLLKRRVFEPATGNDSLPAFRALFQVDQPDEYLSKSISVDGIVLNYFIELNENDTQEPEATEEPDSLHVTISIKSGEWSTLALPFYMTNEQVRRVFGNDVILAEFVKYETNEDKSAISILFKEVNLKDEGLSPRIPYIIKTKKDVTDFYLNAAVQPWGAFAHFYEEDLDTGEFTYGYFVGTYRAQTIVPENCLIISDNAFSYSSGQTELKGFRAFFDFKDVLASPEKASEVILLKVDENSGISQTIAETVFDNRYYDLQGRQVLNPRKGIYIKNGKKVILKKY